MDEVVQPIPREILNLIPLFGGDKRHLNLFIRKCEYVISRYRGEEAQNLYVYHSVTSRLTDNAAALLSEREDVLSWTELKELLVQHFGDPRSEECINIELESLKIKSGESYLDFCNRIQSIRSLLISKVNMLNDVDLKRAKITIYNNTSLNVFLYNLPENMVRIVRLKSPATLEDALSVVLEEVNFHEQYNMRNKIHNNNMFKPIVQSNQNQGFKFGLNPQPSGFRVSAPFPNNIQPKFNFGNQPVPYRMPQVQPQNFGYRPQLGYRPPQFGYRHPQLGNQPQLGYRPPQVGFQPQLGYRPQLGNNQFNGFKFNPNITQQQFGYKPPQVQKPQFQSTDITMRTAPPRPREGFGLNEIIDNDDQQYQHYHDQEFDHDMYTYDVDNVDFEEHNDEVTYCDDQQTVLPQIQSDANFPIQASIKDKK